MLRRGTALIPRCYRRNQLNALSKYTSVAQQKATNLWNSRSRVQFLVNESFVSWARPFWKLETCRHFGVLERSELLYFLTASMPIIASFLLLPPDQNARPK